MALTATAHPVPAAAWDEQIVPALRKRLEAESRMLTKRMSMISTHSNDESSAPYTPSRGGMPDFSQFPSEQASERRRQQTYQESRLEKARQSPVATRPSAIPRPSLQYSRRGDDEQPSPTSQRQRPKRARTQSTPGLHNLPTPASSRSNSPMVSMSPKPSRIPTVTTKAPASPSVPAVPRVPNGLRKASGTAFPPSPETSPDLFPVPAARMMTMPVVAASSRSSLEYPQPSSSVRTKQSREIIHEPPPFATALDSGRLSFSNDEGERPFEHWYRGESRRNGGVGEVKLATQDDLLTIATYGHRMGASPSSTNGFGSLNATPGRRRAGTLSHRESWFMDDNALPDAVMDEQPLTDIETSNLSEFDVSSPNSRTTTPRYPPMDLPGAQISHRQAYQTQQDEAWAQLDLELDRRPSNMSLAASQQGQSRSASRQQQYEQLGVAAGIAPRHQPSNASLRVNTVVANNNGPANASRRSPMSPAQQVAASAQRGRGSPRNASAQQGRRGAPQKPRSKSQPGLRNSPGSGGDEIVEYEMDAIPMWTQPKHNGNWDDVVLPAVAKKMGLTDNYEETDGTPRAARRRESSDRIAPAPGTFGYDDTKYRPPPLQLDEFGRPGEGHQTSGESEEERKQTEPILRPTSPGGLRRGRSTAEPPPSPMPFSSYTHQAPRPLQPPRTASYPQQQQMVQPAPPPERFVLEKQEEEKESGCCRCVIM